MERIYLDVPFDEHEEVCRRRAHWDAQRKCWFIHPEEDIGRFRRWLGRRDSPAAVKPCFSA